MRLGIGGKAFGVRGGISNRGFGMGVGPVSAGGSWPRGRRRRRSKGGSGGLFVLLLCIAGLVSLCSPSHTNTAATTPQTSVVRSPAPSTVAAGINVVPTNPAGVNVVPVGGAVELPEVAGRNAKDVEDELKYLGLTNVELASANPRYSMVLVPANWTVVSIDPQVGTAVEANEHVVVSVTKD